MRPSVAVGQILSLPDLFFARIEPNYSVIELDETSVDEINLEKDISCLITVYVLSEFPFLLPG